MINEKEIKQTYFKKIDDLDNVLHILEVTANHYYSPNDKMWDILLTARDKLKKHIEKEQEEIYKKIKENDKTFKEVEE